MAYGNWGAFVWKNGVYMEDCCDKSIEALDIGGHAVVDCENIIFEIYKNYFPTICEKQEDGKYKRWDEDSLIRHFGIKNLQFDIETDLYLPDDKEEPTIEDIGYRFHNCSVELEFKGIKILYKGYKVAIHESLRELTLKTVNGDIWYIVYGMGFGHGGYEKRKVSRCVWNNLKFDDEDNEYWYDCKNIYKSMEKAYKKDERNRKLRNIKYDVFGIFKCLFKLQLRNVRWCIHNLIDELQRS